MRGLEVGKDLSLISCNHEVPLTDALHPALTTYDIHSELIGRKAVEQLAMRWRGEAASKADVEISLEPSLVEGASVANLV